MPKLNTLGLASASVFLLMGAALLYGPVLRQDANQSVQLLVGAALLALGFLTIPLIVRDWLDGKRHRSDAGRRDAAG